MSLTPSPEASGVADGTAHTAGPTHPTSSRRAHTKSRTGCSDCKRRKCDEAYPSCNHCTRRGITCSLSTSRGSGRALPRRFAGAKAGAVAASAERSSSSAASPASTPTGTDGVEVPGLDIFTRDDQPRLSIAETWGHGLELMHHYATSTANSLAVRPDLQHLWRVEILELAYDSPFLMHIILATAAAHKAHLLPAQRERYSNLAIFHQTAGIEGFRSALADLHAYDWRCVFCFSFMFVFSLDRAPRPPDSAATPIELDCFVFIRGVRAVLAELEPRLDGTFLLLLAKDVYASDAEWSSSFEQTLSSRHSALPPGQAQAFEDMSAFFDGHLSPERASEYQHAVRELKRGAYCIARAGPSIEMGLSMAAAYLIPENVMKDMLALDPFGCVLLAQFCVFFRLQDTRYWFISGLSKRLFALIDDRLATRPAHLAVIKWARTQVFEFWENC